MPRPVVRLTKDLTAAIRSGHPWLFDGAVDRRDLGAEAGAVVDVASGRQRLAVGFVDPGAPIAVRLLASSCDLEPDDAWAREAARSAAAMRARDPRLAACDGVRLIHGESDGMPGLVVDCYAGWAAMITDGAGAAGFWRPRLPAVVEGLGLAGYSLAGALLRRQGRRGGEPALIAGDQPPDRVTIRENDASFEVDLRRGQKTGFFLDQRDNRLVARELAAGAEVLNLFGYTGGFSVQAALGGASRVTTVDIAAPAIEAARRNFAHNQLEPDEHRFVAADVNDFLAGHQQRYDIVICDPPSYAPSERARGKALEAYRALNRAALAAVVPGGWLLTASCSSHIGESDLIAVLATAARRADRRVRLREIRGAATDHPVRPEFPEGRYLTMLVVAVD